MNDVDLEWSKRCVVGDISKDWNLEDISLEFTHEGFYNFKFESMGNNKVLIVADSIDNALGLVNEENEWLSHMLTNVRPWHEMDVIRVRKTWVNIFGVPLHGWNEGTFELIDNKLGKFVKVDKGMSDKSLLAHGRVLIESWHWSSINKKLNIEINKKRFPIWVLEGGESSSTRVSHNLIDNTDIEEISSDSESLDLENDRENQATSVNPFLISYQNESTVHRNNDVKEKEAEQTHSRESSNAWGTSLATHEASGNNNSRFQKSHRAEEPTENLCIIKDPLEGPTRADNWNTNLLGGANTTNLEGGVSNSSGPELNTQAHSDFFRQDIDEAQVHFNTFGSNTAEAQKDFNSDGPSIVPCSNSIEVIDSDPFVLAPYIEKAFSRKKKKETHNMNFEKAVSNKANLINKRKAWEEFLLDMDSEEDKNRANRKGKQKLRKPNRGKIGKLKSRDSPALKGADRATPTSNDINHCNEVFWRRNSSDEAEMVFENSKLMGFSIDRDRAILIPELIEMEERERGRMQAEAWSVCGDFNTVTNQSERKGSNRLASDKKCRQFCKFIENSDLIDLPLLRRKFTWYKDNGTCCSRIDRFLVSKK
ncbi:hypothetical protein ACS0TY_023481 [Phlomoides rotata]